MILCRYSTIKFMPDVETNEFVTVGVVIHCPQTGEVLYELAEKNFERVSRFWNCEYNDLYSNAHKLIESMLDSIKVNAKTCRMRGNALVQFMNNQTTPNDGFIVFSETQAIMTYDDHAQALLNELFVKLVVKHA